jgi:predicted nucleic acid-binding protein
VRVYVDANIIIYLIECPPGFGARAAAFLGAIRTAGHRICTSDLSRLECRVVPLRTGDTASLARFDAFFSDPDVDVLPLTAAVCERASEVRAIHQLKPLDSLHLAAAIVHGCDRFLTNDIRLNACTAIPIDVLP